MNRAVFLDRDGVINKAIVRSGKPYPPSSIAELNILPGVELALKKLKAVGFLLIVVTNQPDVATGKTTKIKVDEINNFLIKNLPLDEIRTCYHEDKDMCECRKPLAGSLFAAASKFQIDLRASFMVGDRWRDIEAGKAAGCKTFFINYGYKEKQPNSTEFTVQSLAEAVEIITKEFNSD
jgi:D-glycero-D-manno-heptose 1,7-bisphosphate phosphatase